ncbi:hypothetical protein JCM15765_00510 [Paradesulfitobacterium aromaticivorans]
MDAVTTTKNFLDILNTIEKDWGSWVDELKRCEEETQDLLHEIELTKFDASRGYRLCRDLQEVRQRRRQLKDEMDVARVLKEFLDINKQLKINLFKVLTSMERVEEGQGRRMYTPRVRTDLTLNERGEAG